MEIERDRDAEAEERYPVMCQPFRKFGSQAQADAWFDRVWRKATPEEQNAIARAYFQVTMRAATHAARTLGGAAGRTVNTHAPPKMHAKLAKFFAAVDSIHDFGLETINYVEAVMVADFPVGLKPEDVENENVFIQHLANMPVLRWADGTQLPNPAYRCNFIDAPFVIRRSPTATMDELYEKQQNHYRGKNNSGGVQFVPVDVWTIMDETIQEKQQLAHIVTEVIQLTQMAECIGVMRKRLGSCAFVVDASGNSLWTALLGARYLNHTFWSRFKVEPAMATRDLDSVLKIYIRKLDPDLDAIQWTVETVDANLWDAGNNASPFPLNMTQTTGPIFPVSLGPQIALHGITNRGERKVHAVITEEGASKPIILAMTNNQTTKEFSTNHLRDVIEKHATREMHLKYGLKWNHRYKTPMEADLFKLAPTTLFALKRAGDWGQVQWCARHNAVFWTADKMAALYAYVRGVRFVWTRWKEFFGASDGMPLTPHMVQYSFVVRG
jgi:hypothetical protein